MEVATRAEQSLSIQTNLEWVGPIPSEWHVKPAKYLLSERNERSVTGEEQLLSVSEYYGVKPRSSVIDEGDFLSRAESLVGYKRCYVHDLVINIMLAWKRGLGVSDYEGIVSPAYSVFELGDELESAYMHYFLRTNISTTHFKSLSTGVIDSRLRLYPETFGSINLPVPSLEEQRKIAQFLDHEIAKIDTLIKKQQQLIELLKEKRQAVISHAVTKGLNPDAPMKDSGIEWLGEIPEGWEVNRVGRHTELIGGYAFSSSDFVEDGIQLIRIGNLYQNRLDLNRSPVFLPKSFQNQHEEFLVKRGDILISLTGTLGKRDYGFSIMLVYRNK